MKNSRCTSTLKRAAVAAGIVTAGLGLTACGEEEADTAGSEQKVSIDELLQTPQQYVDQTVVVSADVNDDISPQAFSIAGTDESQIPPLLVIHLEDKNDPAEEGTSFDPQDGVEVEVTGTVEGSLDVKELEQQSGKDLNETALENWAGQPYLKATDVEVIGDN
ncbi:hypothetical protein [Arthrobacter castelli]|uniref:hypothetical protein n=1 Tax=Arthrobacter castelli TaxID=271431 RepID=UPI0004068F1D|nr:hypothetical protein [Arthrobacter castelli]